MTNRLPQEHSQYVVLTLDEAKSLAEAIDLEEHPQLTPAVERLQGETGADIRDIVHRLTSIAVCGACVIEGQMEYCETHRAKRQGRRLRRLLERAHHINSHEKEKQMTDVNTPDTKTKIQLRPRFSDIIEDLFLSIDVDGVRRRFPVGYDCGEFVTAPVRNVSAFDIMGASQRSLLLDKIDHTTTIDSARIERIVVQRNNETCYIFDHVNVVGKKALIADAQCLVFSERVSLIDTQGVMVLNASIDGILGVSTGTTQITINDPVLQSRDSADSFKTVLNSTELGYDIVAELEG